MKLRHSALTVVAALMAAGCTTSPTSTSSSASMASPGADVTSDRLAKADSEPGNWMTYHGSYASWHYSGLTDINITFAKLPTPVDR